MNKKENEIAVNKPHIRFINTLYQTLFFIEDGEEIEIGVSGEAKRYTCRFIDEHHTRIGEQVYHIREFAEFMEFHVLTCKPAQKQEAA